MKKPKIDETQLEILLDCFYEEFTSLHGANTSKLDEYPIYIMNRMSCAKAAHLNFIYPATAGDGQIVQMHNSGYVDAINTLEQRGLVKWMPNTPLAFNLTILGYNKIYKQRAKPVLSWWQKIRNSLNNNPGPIGVLAIAVGAFFTWLFSK